MPLITLVHNDHRFLPSFFNHYRAMGVTRFICVDDQSQDGSREFLLSQADADVYTSNVRYREAARGKVWRELLFQAYGSDRWYLNVDSDEYFQFESIGHEAVGRYAQFLLGRGIRRLPAVMLDMYPVGRLEQAHFDGTDDTMPWEVATHFDGADYLGLKSHKSVRFSGGVRKRLFGLEAELIKYPLIYWQDGCSLGKSIHRPLPAKHNFAPALGCLLHFHIFSDYLAKLARTVDNGQHFCGAELYRMQLEQIQQQGMPELQYEHSIGYRGPHDLIERGFMLPLKPDQSTSLENGVSTHDIHPGHSSPLRARRSSAPLHVHHLPERRTVSR